MYFISPLQQCKEWNHGTHVHQEPEDVEETIELARDILARGGGSLLEHLLQEIRSALSRRETHGDMTRQLMRLCAENPLGGGEYAPALVRGKLMYRTGHNSFVWGSWRYVAAGGYTIEENRSIGIVGGTPAWIETPIIGGHGTRVVWNGTPGKPYSYRSIQRILDCGGVPCYAVNAGQNPHEYEGFVVLRETEGEHFFEVTDLTVFDHMPLYVGHSLGRGAVIKWGTETVCEGHHIAGIETADRNLRATVTRSDGSTYLWTKYHPPAF